MLELHRDYKSVFPDSSVAASYCSPVLANSAILWLLSGADHTHLPLQAVGAQVSPPQDPSPGSPCNRAQLCPGKADLGFP